MGCPRVQKHPGAVGSLGALVPGPWVILVNLGFPFLEALGPRSADGFLGLDNHEYSVGCAQTRRRCLGNSQLMQFYFLFFCLMLEDMLLAEAAHAGSNIQSNTEMHTGLLRLILDYSD